MRGVDEGSARLRAGGWTRGDPRFGDPRYQFKAYNVAAGHMSLHPDFIRMVNAASSPSLDVFEFGVYTGSRMREFGQRLHGFGRMWGFDSFTGFPEESREQACESRAKSLQGCGDW